MKTETGWNDQQEQVIAMYQEKLGMSRSNAIRKLRGQELRGITAAQILTAPVEPKLKQVHEKPAPRRRARKAPSQSNPRSPLSPLARATPTPSKVVAVSTTSNSW